MIQIDLEALKARFYNIGKGLTVLTPDDSILLKSLDYWQRNEVLEHHKAGADDMQAEMLK